MSNSSKKPYARIASPDTQKECLDFLKKKLNIPHELISKLVITFDSSGPIVINMEFWAEEAVVNPTDKRLDDIEYHFFNHPLDVTARV